MLLTTTRDDAVAQNLTHAFVCAAISQTKFLIDESYIGLGRRTKYAICSASECINDFVLSLGHFTCFYH